MKPVAWRWTNQFGKEVLTSNREFANLMEDKGVHVEPLYPERWEDKREQQTANAVDSAPSDCTTASQLSSRNQGAPNA